MHTDESATEQLIYRNCCSGCGEAKPPDAFYRDGDSATGHQASCKDCVKSRAAAWRRDNPERHRAHVATWKARHTAEVRRYETNGRQRQDEAARVFVRTVVRVASATRRAIKAGQLVRPDHCGACARSGVKLDGVHEDYAKALEVTWLCRRCHYQWSLARRQAQETSA